MTDKPRPLPAQLLTAAAIAVAALALRMYDIADKSIWLDEAWSWRAARLPLDAMMDWTAQDKHPPLYYGVLHFWIDLFGDRETGLRTLSAVAGALSAGAVAYAGWRVAGWPLAIVAGAFMAAHPTAVEFSQEARMYPLVGTLGLLATIALAANIDRPSIPRAILYAAVAAAAIYTHYSAFLLLAVHAAVVLAYAALRWRADGRRIALTSGAAFALLAVAYIPWYANFLDHAREGVGHLPDPSWTLVDVVFSALLGLQWMSDVWLAAAIPLVGLGLWGLWKRAANPYALCVAAIALVPLMQLAISIIRTPVFDARQASPYIAGFALILALGLLELGIYLADLLERRAVERPAAFAGAAVLALVMLLGARDWYDRGPREDWRAAAQDVESVPGSAFVWRGYTMEPLSFYTERPLTPRGPTGARLLVAERQPAVLVLSHESPADRQALLSELGAVYVLGEPTTYPGITVVPLRPR